MFVVSLQVNLSSVMCSRANLCDLY